MGYYTRFKVDFKTVGELSPPLMVDKPEIFVPVLNPLIDRGYPMFEGDGWSNDVLKWYGWGRDMMAASAQMPGVLITLTGSGEEDGDIWRAYFLDGRVQCTRPRIEFEPFDEGKLSGSFHMESRHLVNIWE